MPARHRAMHKLRSWTALPLQGYVMGAHIAREFGSGDLTFELRFSCSRFSGTLCSLASIFPRTSRVRRISVGVRLWLLTLTCGSNSPRAPCEPHSDRQWRKIVLKSSQSQIRFAASASSAYTLNSTPRGPLNMAISLLD